MPSLVRSLAIAGLLAGSLLAAAPAAAAGPAPANDDLADAIVIDTFPFTATQDTTGATSGPGDPGTCAAPEAGPDSFTVWYRWTAPASGPIAVATWGSDYDTSLQVGTSDGSGGIDVLACNEDTRELQAALRFDAVAGETYLFVVGMAPWAWEPAGGQLVFTLDVGPAAQAADATLDPVGSISKGVVRFSGRVSCAAIADLSSLVILELRQSGGPRETGAGTAFLDVSGCPGDDLAFEIEVPADAGRFHPGAATAQLLWFACNHYECANAVIDLQVTIAK